MAMMDAARGLGVAASGFQGSIFEVWTLDQRQVWLNFDLDFFWFRFTGKDREERPKDENSCCIDKQRVGVKKEG